jgi:hypothetical protein
MPINAPGFGQALLWSHLSDQLGDWRSRNVDKRREQEDAARVAMLDQQRQTDRAQDIAYRTTRDATEDQRYSQERTDRNNLLAMEQKGKAVAGKQDLAAEDRRFQREKELIALRAAATPRASRPAPPPVQDEGEATTRLYETARDMALAGRSPQEIANFVARDDQPFKRFFQDPRQRFAIVNQAAQDAANARAKAAPTARATADPAVGVDRLRRLAADGSPQADLAFQSTFQKVLDPSGVIRDEDIKRMESAGTWSDRLGGLRQRVQGRGPLTPNQKEGFIRAAGTIAGQPAGTGGISPAEAEQLRAMGYTDAEIRSIGGD